MEQVFHSEESSSSGSESGWTLYLDQSISIHDHFYCKNASPAHDQQHEHHDDDDDNMSMVSDASSGPPHFQEHQEHDIEDEDDIINGVFCDPCLVFGSRKRRKIITQTGFCTLQDLPAVLDDTASSPFFSFSNKDLTVCNEDGLMADDTSFVYSQGHSTTNFEMV